MKKIIFSALVCGLALASCADNGTEVEAKDAVTIENTETAETVKMMRFDAESNLEWFGSHIGGVGAHNGRVMLKSVEVGTSNETLESATVIIDMSTLVSDDLADNEEKANNLKGHLSSGDFFDVENHPTVKFELASVEPNEGEFNSTLVGNLTILDSTKSISFKANVNVSPESVTIASDKFAIDRTMWGIIYKAEGTEGLVADKVIANDIGFRINVKVTK